MAKTYNIVEGNASVFASNKNIKFPRFQRKQTWDETDNFKLCISVFKGYPIGVVIVNSQNRNDYLLDGRQRKNALKLMKDDPNAVYVWAQKYVGFKLTEDPEEVKDKFWKKIDNYLQHDAAKIKTNKQIQAGGNEEQDQDDNADQTLSDEDKQNAFDFEKQYTSLKSLLELVLLCHPMRNDKTNLQKMFEFNGIIPIQDLDYSEPSGSERKVSSTKLKKYIDGLISEEINTPELFIDSLIRRYKLNSTDSGKISKYVNQHWEYYSQTFNVIQQVDDVIDGSSIGVITLINADILDAQNIFSLVNGSGTPLSAEELLSARPFWNIDLGNTSSELLEKRKEMYKFLEIDLPETACRWDLAATFLKRIDKNSLIFSKNLTFTTSISLSFRLISGFFVKGINNTSITALEKATIDWDVDIEKRIEEINTVISLLEDIKLFKTMMAWNQSIMSLTSNSIAIEYCCLMYQAWKDLGCPVKSSASVSQFNRKAVYLFDKLIYEYSIRMWTGSGDSTVASHLKAPSSRFNSISEKEWTDFIDDIKSGQYKGKPTTTKTLKPFVFYHYFLRDMLPTLKNTDTKYDVDHLVAQSLFADNDAIDQTYKNNYLNFSVLPKGENIEKTNKRLNEITDSWLIEQIKKYAMIDTSDFETLSDLSKVSKLSKRKKAFIDSYKTFRNALFANL